MFNALTIAGSDSCGGAGIQADLKAFSANGVYGMSVITAVTAQNTQGVLHVQDMDPITIEKQIDAIFEDIKIDSVKIGMVSRVESIETIADTLKKYKLPPIILDPVMVSKSGYRLLSANAKEALVKHLFPMAYLITPNIPEAFELTGADIRTVEDMKEACKKLIGLGPANVLLKGGHLEDAACDLLFDGAEFHVFEQERINSRHTHGTGCTLSSAIAANISKGQGLKEAVSNAKEYVTTAIRHGFALGKGIGPTHHFYTLYNKAGLI
jgi:hydroxymethylpyrimidine/phosphomethylpyrimidine kinase